MSYQLNDSHNRVKVLSSCVSNVKSLKALYTTIIFVPHSDKFVQITLTFNENADKNANTNLIELENEQAFRYDVCETFAFVPKISTLEIKQTI